jgi:hypothetical protein
MSDLRNLIHRVGGGVVCCAEAKTASEETSIPGWLS